MKPLQTQIRTNIWEKVQRESTEIIRIDNTHHFDSAFNLVWNQIRQQIKQPIFAEVMYNATISSR